MSDYTTAGERRLVVGAHYGTFEYVAQRVTAVVIALFSAYMAVMLITARSPMQYADWASIFTWAPLGVPVGKLFAFIAVLSVCYHAWVGMRDIWMDYVKPTGIRLVLLVLTVLWLVAAAAYAGATLLKV